MCSLDPFFILQLNANALVEWEIPDGRRKPTEIRSAANIIKFMEHCGAFLHLNEAFSVLLDFTKIRWSPWNVQHMSLQRICAWSEGSITFCVHLSVMNKGIKLYGIELNSLMQLAGLIVVFRSCDVTEDLEHLLQGHKQSTSTPDLTVNHTRIMSRFQTACKLLRFIFLLWRCRRRREQIRWCLCHVSSSLKGIDQLITEILSSFTHSCCWKPVTFFVSFFRRSDRQLHTVTVIWTHYSLNNLPLHRVLHLIDFN